jgi:hypothetical protein
MMHLVKALETRYHIQPFTGRLHGDLPALSNNGSSSINASRLVCELTRRHSRRPGNHPRWRVVPLPSPVRADLAAGARLSPTPLSQGAGRDRKPRELRPPQDRIGEDL